MQIEFGIAPETQGQIRGLSTSKMAVGMMEDVVGGIRDRERANALRRMGFKQDMLGALRLGRLVDIIDVQEMHDTDTKLPPGHQYRLNHKWIKVVVTIRTVFIVEESLSYGKAHPTFTANNNGSDKLPYDLKARCIQLLGVKELDVPEEGAFGALRCVRSTGDKRVIVNLDREVTIEKSTWLRLRDELLPESAASAMLVKSNMQREVTVQNLQCLLHTMCERPILLRADEYALVLHANGVYRGREADERMADQGIRLLRNRETPGDLETRRGHAIKRDEFIRECGELVKHMPTKDGAQRENNLKTTFAGPDGTLQELERQAHDDLTKQSSRPR